MISSEEFKNTVEEMLFRAATKLPKDVVSRLEKAREEEENEIAREQLNNILKNLKIAEKDGRPMCQDTGVPVFFVKKPESMALDFEIGQVLKKAVQNATEEIPLRPNIVSPLERENSGNNTGLGHPIWHCESSKEEFKIELLLKGGGSENWSNLFMLNPTISKEEIVSKVSGFVEEAGGQFCPPGIIGIGLGGTADLAFILAKKSLLQPIDQENEKESLEKLGEKIQNRVNDSGTGPMGLGGNNTVLGVNILEAGCHTASLPLAINLQCWAARRSKARQVGEELIVEVPE